MSKFYPSIYLSIYLSVSISISISISIIISTSISTSISISVSISVSVSTSTSLSISISTSRAVAVAILSAPVHASAFVCASACVCPCRVWNEKAVILSCFFHKNIKENSKNIVEIKGILFCLFKRKKTILNLLLAATNRGVAPVRSRDSRFARADINILQISAAEGEGAHASAGQL